jgi:hypothetical protein
MDRDFINAEVPRKALRSTKRRRAMKTRTHYAKATMLLVVFATLVSVVGAKAQSTVFAGKFTLPYQVRWGQAMLPAGDYSIRFSSLDSPATVHSMDGKISAFVFTGRRADSEKGPSSLTIMTLGNERRVISMSLPGSGVSLVYSPLTKTEQEELAKAKQIETVPLVATK